LSDVYFELDKNFSPFIKGRPRGIYCGRKALALLI